MPQENRSKKRRWHYMKANNRSERFTNLIFFDTETFVHQADVQILTFRLVCAEYVRRQQYSSKEKRESNRKDIIEQFVSKSKSEFWDWVVSKVRKKSKMIMIAHNADFDLRILDAYNELPKRGYILFKQPIIDSNRLVVWFRNEKEKNSILFIDSFNWFKKSIEQMGELLNFPKLKPLDEYGDWNKIPDHVLIEYCMRDVQILRTFILQFFDWWYENDLGVLGKTMASCAFNAFRHRFMKHKILVHWHEDARRLERESYRGGRCEAFYIGKVPGKVYRLDINSMYPFVMKTKPYPCKFLAYMENNNIKDLFHQMKQYLVIAKVLIQIDQPLIGVKRDFGEGERLIFPVGRFWAVLTSPELELVAKYGKILDVTKTAIYTKDEGVFTEFINFFYNERLKAKAKGDQIHQEFYKLIMNSLYGKMGQKSEKFVEVGKSDKIGVFTDSTIEIDEGGKIIKTTYYCFGGKKYVKSPDFEEGYETNVAIASFVTSYARCYLVGLIMKAGWENVYYCDTDSLFVNEKGYQNLLDLVSSTELGKLKLEEIGDCEILNSKDYIFNGKVKRKGIKKGAKLIYEDDKVAVYEQDFWCKFRTLVRTADIDKGIIEKVIKKLSKEYKKAIVEGNRVKPFILWEV